MSLIFDCETGPRPADEIRAFIPTFDVAAHLAKRPPVDFDPATVAVGGLKDPAKITAKIEAARAAHFAAIEAFDANLAELEKTEPARLEAEFLANAALSPVYGRVLAIGMRAASGAAAIVGDRDERSTLTEFWGKYAKCRAANRKLIGANIFGFDLPFLIRRSWILGVDVPPTVRDGRYWDRAFVDVREVWLCGQRWNDCPSSLDHMGEALGCGKKLDGVNGGDFHKLWNGTPEERKQATAYLLRDLELTAKVAERIGVL